MKGLLRQLQVNKAQRIQLPVLWRTETLPDGSRFVFRQPRAMKAPEGDSIFAKVALDASGLSPDRHLKEGIGTFTAKRWAQQHSVVCYQSRNWWLPTNK